MPVGQEERRQAPRYSVELKVEFRHLGRPQDTFADLTRDISAGGIFVDTTVGLPLGTEVALEITPSGDVTPIRVRAEVVRVEEQPGQTGSKATTRTRGMALKFLEVEGGSATDINRLLGLVNQVQREGSHAHSGGKTGKKR
ncbi:MAG: PilZ domain-containing protein [Deltaproteobacteria bacterium]|nr:PilZ domain-containing protein [Deltaproteobacteria bacterium]